MGKKWKQWQILFSWAPKSLQTVSAAMKLKDACFLEKKKNYDKPRQHIRNQRHYFADKGPYSQNCGFSKGHVQMWVLNRNEGWALKNWCFWTAVLKKTLESPLESKEIKPVNPKEISSEYSLEGLMLKLKLQSFSHLMQRTNSLEKTLMLGKIEVRRRGWQMMKWLDGIIYSTEMSLSKLRKIVKDREAWSAPDHGITKSWTQVSD